MVPSNNLICGFYEGRDRNKEQELEELVRDMLLALNKYEDVEPYLARFLEVVNYDDIRRKEEEGGGSRAEG